MVSEQKQQLVHELVQDIQHHPIVGVVNLQNLPAQQLQTMRAMLAKKKVKIRMARKRLLYRALAEAKKENMQELTKKIKSIPPLIFS